ncbi:MAG: ATP-dependent Clp protease proteolytic subunit [Myxococcales bacterium]|nr:ATP-dependent Clp protease proteolytic subunit [Myxococcales bacterium]
MAEREAASDLSSVSTTTPTATPSIPERLFDSRTVLVFGEITTELAQSVCEQLFALSAASDAPIRVIVHSPGGHVEAGDTIHDVLRCIAPEVHMLGTGWVASAGALIYMAAPRERRFALKNTRFMLHQPAGSVGGRASDIEIEARELTRMRDRITEITAAATGRDVELVRRDTERNHWMTAAEALEYGLVGAIVDRMSALPR